MAQIHLSVVTPKGICFDEDADRVMVRTTGGDVSILPGHIDYTASLGKGTAKVTIGDNARFAEIDGGVINVVDNDVKILTASFAWKE